jgi:ubiquinone/menaquinone biosynthesis C-methylase UbiE
VLTIIHHVYGAIAFDTPWRHHAAFLGLGGIAATLLCMTGATRWRTPVVRRLATILLLALTLVLAVGLIGVFEGGYNHAVKLVLFLGGAGPDTMNRLFPPPTYEMPSDGFFEVTGVLQFLAALFAARASLALWHGSHESVPSLDRRSTCSEGKARSESRPFVPGMGVDWLLPLYDSFTRLLRLDRARRDLLLQADLRPGHRVLDIGCGTGSLVVLVKQLFPDVEVIGLDPDAKALARATRKAQRVGATVQFERGFSDAIEYSDASFDRVFSSFMFHHLERDEKERMLREVRRVLKVDGRMHLLDFGAPDPAGRASRLPRLHSHRRLTDNDERTILGLLRGAGFTKVTKTGERAVLKFVQIVFYCAGRSLT